MTADAGVCASRVLGLIVDAPSSVSSVSVEMYLVDRSQMNGVRVFLQTRTETEDSRAYNPS